MTIRYKCDQCGSTLKIKDKLAGTAGKCPKCKSEFTVPEPSESDSGPTTPPAEISEEDAIFGKGFFEQKEERSSRPKFTVPTDDDGDDDDSFDDFPVSSPTAAAPISSPHSLDNAANIAGNLLGKTGKKNAKEEWTEDEGPKYDFSAVRYLITHRILPGVGGGVILVYVFYYFFAGMINEERVIPPLAALTGTVTLDGKPVQAELTFNPVDSMQSSDSKSSFKGANSKAWTNPADGRYTAMYTSKLEGAILGKHEVTIVLGPGRIEVRKIEVIAGPNVGNFSFETVSEVNPAP
jgi:DNA-directed RNA polymerase subunit RPC12/RpoP